MNEISSDPSAESENPYLPIYGQDRWHDEAFIVANLPALLLLRKAIDGAIHAGHGYVPAYTGDCEGFNTLVSRVDDPKEFDDLAVLYNDEIARERRNDAERPWKLPRIVLARADSTAWIEKQYGPEEAQEIRDIIAEERKIREAKSS